MLCEMARTSYLFASGRRTWPWSRSRHTLGKTSGHFWLRKSLPLAVYAKMTLDVSAVVKEYIWKMLSDCSGGMKAFILDDFTVGCFYCVSAPCTWFHFFLCRSISSVLYSRKLSFCRRRLRPKHKPCSESEWLHQQTQVFLVERLQHIPVKKLQHFKVHPNDNESLRLHFCSFEGHTSPQTLQERCSDE